MMQSYEPQAQSGTRPSGTLNHDKLEEKLSKIFEEQQRPIKKDWAGYYDNLEKDPVNELKYPPIKHMRFPKHPLFWPIKKKDA